MIEHKETQHAQHEDHKGKWLDPYHEKDMEHTHAGNLIIANKRNYQVWVILYYFNFIVSKRYYK